ncbi:MAG: phage protein Gp36 family protein [Bryobacteraceae bacterium]
MAYTTQTLIETQFGRENVRKWADLNSSGVATEIAARVTLAITNADSLIDATLRDGLYSVPFADPVPTEIIVISTQLAGVDIYTSRGIEDTDAAGEEIHRLNGVHKKAMNTLNAIKAGRIKLDLDRTTSVPKAIEHHHRYCNSPPWGVDTFHRYQGD